MTVTLVENRPVSEALQPADGSGRFLVQVITPGWGSSGYYSQEVLETAGRERVWPAGTHMYLDHPTESDTYERPERSVRDLAAVLTEDARWDPAQGALVAEARVFSQWRQPLSEMLDAIGVSIRGAAEGELGEAEGRKGRVFTRLVEGASIDFVTHAGRGGKVLQVLESTRTTAQEARNVGQWVESRIHRDFTVLADEMFGDGRLTREERITLSGGIGDALSAFVARIEADAPGLYERDIWDEPTSTAPTPAVETDGPTSVPSRPAGQSTATESKEDTMATIPVEERELATLKETAGRAPVLESERDAAIQKAEEVERKLAVYEARTRFRPTVAKVLNESESLPPVMRQRVTDQVIEAIAPDATEESIKAAATEARTNAEAEAAAIAEMYGVGAVRNFGGATTPTDDGAPSVAALDEAGALAFGRHIKEA